VSVRDFSVLPALFVSECGVLWWVMYVSETEVGLSPGYAQQRGPVCRLTEVL